MALNQKGDPDIIYGTVFNRHLQTILNTRLSYPDEEIYLFDDYIKDTFRNIKYHPDVASSVSFIIVYSLFQWEVHVDQWLVL